MSFAVELKGKQLEIKFNYGMLFKANKKLGTKDAQGNSQNDGAGVLFVKVLEEDDDALFDIIKLASKDKVTDEDIAKSVQDFVETFEDEEEGYSMVFETLKQEMLDSGFFVKKLKKYINNLEKAADYLKS
ncbi:tail assembly chaperone [Enterococcus faecalis]|uniref:tail assembly chaperone n=2 Tax=cellular organisms TaxID=131567 RepID=UPI002032B608